MAHTSDGRSERWREHREARRDELIAAVIGAVVRGGPGVGMDDISRLTGIAKPTFYRYFTDKAGVFLAVGRAVAGAVVTDITDAISRQATPEAMLAAGIDVYLERIEASPAVYRFVTQRALPVGPLEDYATIVGLHVSRVIGEYLRAAHRDTGAAEAWGFGLVGMVRASAERWLEHPVLSRDAVSAHLAQLAWSGLGQVVATAGRLRVVND